jgi:hypothetical protein
MSLKRQAASGKQEGAGPARVGGGWRVVAKDLTTDAITAESTADTGDVQE